MTQATIFPLASPEPMTVEDPQGEDPTFEHIENRDYARDSVTASELSKDKSFRISEYLEGKSQSWMTVHGRKRPLNLLELPTDILRLIVKEITHTTDLTALALTNTALHELATPLIYSRFDIVWPDGQVTPSDSKNVDALTYGLATLCMGNAFARTTRRLLNPGGPPVQRVLDNDHGRYTRKFSLGNGPNVWVTEYMITKESGKMLGTLVAIAIAKMKNLESFVWDMPTGVLSDIFMSLASLTEQSNGECKLSRVWVRWHDNRDGTISPSGSNGPAFTTPAVVPAGSVVTPVGILLPQGASHPPSRPPVQYSQHHVEYPTFSVLPPLKSLTVLDIDELSYLDEMALLIEQSKHILHELRVGISALAINKDFVQAWDGPGLKQVDHRARWPGESTIGERRLGGVLGVLVGKIYDIRKSSSKVRDKTLSNACLSPDTALPSASGTTAQSQAIPDAVLPNGGVILQDQSPDATQGLALSEDSIFRNYNALSSVKANLKKVTGGRKRLEEKLKLYTLELERIPLSLHVCKNAIDWSILTNLTILDCAHNESLWKMLRKQFQPTSIHSTYGISSKQCSNPILQYHLSLKHIHTDMASPALINFIRETLAPNTLEVLFLHDRRRTTVQLSVTMEAVFKGAIKRHRTSLRKLLLDSSARTTAGAASNDSSRWRLWVLSTEIMLYIMSGRMNSLRELAVSLAYKDWHGFLQRLPNMPQLRSIYFPHIADHVSGDVEPRELSNQILDIITLRPEIRLSYVGIGTKCFEFLEIQGKTNAPSSRGAGSLGTTSQVSGNAQPSSTGVTNQSVDPDDLEEEDTSDEDGEGMEDETVGSGDENTPASAGGDLEETLSERNDSIADDDDDDEFVEPDRGRVRLRLREILFYDDKIAIFKARHARL